MSREEKNVLIFTDDCEGAVKGVQSATFSDVRITFLSSDRSIGKSIDRMQFVNCKVVSTSASPIIDPNLLRNQLLAGKFGPGKLFFFKTLVVSSEQSEPFDLLQDPDLLRLDSLEAQKRFVEKWIALLAFAKKIRFEHGIRLPKFILDRSGKTAESLTQILGGKTDLVALKRILEAAKAVFNEQCIETPVAAALPVLEEDRRSSADKSSSNEGIVSRCDSLVNRSLASNSLSDLSVASSQGSTHGVRFNFAAIETVSDVTFKEGDSQERRVVSVSLEARNAEFKGSVDFCDCVFESAELLGSTFSHLVVNDKTDLRKIKIDNCNVPSAIEKITFVTKKGEQITADVGAFYDELKKQYGQDEKKSFFFMFRSKKEKTTWQKLEEKYPETDPNFKSKILFEMLRHRKSQEKNWIFRRTYDAFEKTLSALKKRQNASAKVVSHKSELVASVSSDDVRTPSSDALSSEVSSAPSTPGQEQLPSEEVEAQTGNVPSDARPTPRGVQLAQEDLEAELSRFMCEIDGPSGRVDVLNVQQLLSEKDRFYALASQWQAPEESNDFSRKIDRLALSANFTLKPELDSLDSDAFLGEDLGDQGKRQQHQDRLVAQYVFLRGIRHATIDEHNRQLRSVIYPQYLDHVCEKKGKQLAPKKLRHNLVAALIREAGVVGDDFCNASDERREQHTAASFFNYQSDAHRKDCLRRRAEVSWEDLMQSGCVSQEDNEAVLSAIAERRERAADSSKIEKHYYIAQLLRRGEIEKAQGWVDGMMFADSRFKLNNQVASQMIDLAYEKLTKSILRGESSSPDIEFSQKIIAFFEKNDAVLSGRCVVAQERVGALVKATRDSYSVTELLKRLVRQISTPPYVLHEETLTPLLAFKDKSLFWTGKNQSKQALAHDLNEHANLHSENPEMMQLCMKIASLFDQLKAVDDAGCKVSEVSKELESIREFKDKNTGFVVRGEVVDRHNTGNLQDEIDGIVSPVFSYMHDLLDRRAQYRKDNIADESVPCGSLSGEGKQKNGDREPLRDDKSSVYYDSMLGSENGFKYLLVYKLQKAHKQALQQLGAGPIYELEPVCCQVARVLAPIEKALKGAKQGVDAYNATQRSSMLGGKPSTRFANKITEVIGALGSLYDQYGVPIEYRDLPLSASDTQPLSQARPALSLSPS